MRDEVVVVTGAGSGIGEAVALACARREAKVAVVDVDPHSTARVAALAEAAGSSRAVGVECDVASDDSVRSAFKEIRRVLGLPTRVVANAGIEVNAPLHDFDAAQWRRVVEVNLVGVFLTCKEAVRGLLQAGSGGSIVCTSSPAAFVGFSGGGNSAYAASKGGVSAFVRSAALDYAPHGIRVNAVVPGATETQMILAGSDDGTAEHHLSRIRADAAEQVPLGRLAQPDEIAAAVTWLLSDASSYVTGTNLVCDGGLLAKSANDF